MHVLRNHIRNKCKLRRLFSFWKGTLIHTEQIVPTLNWLVPFAECSAKRNIATNLSIGNNKYVPFCRSLFRKKMFRRAKRDARKPIIVLPAMAFTEGEQSVMQISFPYIVPL